MADVSKLNLYGTNYNIKDSNARSLANNANSKASTAQTTANEAKSEASTAQTTANTNAENITKIINSSVKIEYEESSETVKVSSGITI